MQNIKPMGKYCICAASELYKDHKLSQELAEEYYLYRWWFPSSSPIVIFLKEYVEQHPEDEEMRHLHCHLKQCKIAGTIYSALYFGKSTNGRERFKKHIKGPMKNSTLRRTIYSLLAHMPTEQQTEERISEILGECYYEWIELPNDHELMGPFETMAIALGGYPLNLDGNHHLSSGWKNKIVQERKNNTNL